MFVRVERDVRSFEDIIHDKAIKRWETYLKGLETVIDPTGKTWYKSPESDRWYVGFLAKNQNAKTTYELAVHCYDEG